MTRIILPLLLAASFALTACGGAETPKVETPEVKTETPAEKSRVSVVKITDGVWIHTSTQDIPGAGIVPSNGLAVADKDGLILIDTAWGELATQELAKELKELTGLDIKKVIITHYHFDRLAGVDWLESQGAEVFTHPMTPNLSAELGTPIPNTSVAALAKLGARTNFGPVEISYPGPGHTEDNLMVWVKAPKLLFGGCAVRAAENKTIGNITNANMSKWSTSLQWAKVTYKDAKMVVPGHGNPAGLELIDHTIALVAKTVNAQKSEKK